MLRLRINQNLEICLKLKLSFVLPENVYVDVLKVIKPHHIERLLKGFDMGTQILFENNLDEWRQSQQDTRIYNDSDVLRSHLLSQHLPSSRSSTRPNTPMSGELVFAPSQNNCTNEAGTSNISLYEILNTTPRGIILVEYYTNFNNFGEDQRNTLINLIASFFEERDLPLSVSTSNRLEREILLRFPTEKLASSLSLLYLFAGLLTLLAFLCYDRLLVLAQN